MSFPPSSPIRLSRRDAGALLLSAAAPLPALAHRKRRSGLIAERGRIEWQERPLGLDRLRPRFSWLIRAQDPKARHVLQSAFRLQLFAAHDLQTPLFDTGKTAGSALKYQPDQDLPLKSQSPYVWRLQVWDPQDRPSTVLQNPFCTGLLSEADASARWIAAETDSPRHRQAIEGRGETLNSALPLPEFRRTFTLDQAPVFAHLAVIGLGQYQLTLNGAQISPEGVNGAWTKYDKRVLYDAYDVTGWLKPGPQTLGVALGNGFFNAEDIKDHYGKLNGSFGQPQMWLQLRLVYGDGREERIVSDANWQTRDSGVLYSSVYGGETFDARIAACADGWRPALEVKGPAGVRRAASFAPMILQQRLTPVSVVAHGPKTLVFDLGLNHSGRPQITLKNMRPGETVRLIPAELLLPGGTIDQQSMTGWSPGYAGICFTYICKGGGEETWRPQFSYTGYRYLQVEGATQGQIARLESEVLFDGLDKAGDFGCSDARMVAIHRLIRQALYSNMASVLTDCPHREKLGWLEQIYLNAATTMMNVDTVRLYEKMTADMRDSQDPSGLIPSIAPEFVKFLDDKGHNTPFRDTPEWGAALILSCWTLFRQYGDADVLAQNYAAMQARIGYLETRLDADGLLNFGLGDWYDIGPNPPGFAQLTHKVMTGTATFYAELTAMAKIAKRLGRTEAGAYAARAEALKQTLMTRLYDRKTARFDTGSQTAQALAITLDLVPEADRQRALDVLIADIRAHGDHITAGDIGFHYVVRALMACGRSDVLYDLLSRDDKPSYGQQIKAGATALTEAWDGSREHSQNHFMLGHAEIWFYQGLGGIRMDASGDSADPILLAPLPVAPIASAEATYLSVFGRVACALSRSGDVYRLKADIPAGATATIRLPNAVLKTVRETGKPLPRAAGVLSVTQTPDSVVLRVGSGVYAFTYPARA